MCVKKLRAVTFGFLSVLIVVTTACSNRPAMRRGSGANPATAVLPAAAAAARTLPPLPVRPLSPQLEATRLRVMQTAATLRELDWKSAAGMTELSGWEYGTRTSEMAEVLGGDDLRALSRLAIAAGVLPEGTDLATLAASFTAVSAGATYSPFDKQVLLFANRSTGDSHLTHEFVHALQDQHFDLQQQLLARPYSFDRTEAVFAVVEGDALNVQRRLEGGEAFARRSLDDITRGENERFASYRNEIGALFPPLLTETFIFRYRDGLRFVETIRRSRGQRGVDDLFRQSPLSSEQILHPEKYLANEAARDAAINEDSFASRGWRMAASTPLGEVGVRGLLMEGVSSKDATRAAAGWGGDRAHLFERPNGVPLFVWKTVWDKPEDAAEFYRAYNLLHSRRNSEQVEAEIVSGNKARLKWSKADRMIHVHRNGDTVIIIRGAEADTIDTAALMQLNY